AGSEGGSLDLFFQAEDGIRDRNVTGVQTCALPICPRPGGWRGYGRTVRLPERGLSPHEVRTAWTEASAGDVDWRGGRSWSLVYEIGRASCRERAAGRELVAYEGERRAGID